MTQDELDCARVVMLAGCLQLSVSEALARMTGDVAQAEQLLEYRTIGDALCNRIASDDLRGSDAGTT